MKEKSLVVLEMEIKNHPILNHPFYELFKAGKINNEQLKIFTEQQYHFSVSFPRCIAAVYSAIPNYAISRKLIDHFLIVEGWGSNISEAHSNLFRKWMEYMSLSEENCIEGLLPETIIFNKNRIRLCKDNNYFVGLGALAFGHELLNQGIFSIYYEGLQRKNIPKEALSYFSAHTRDEIEDYNVLKDMILQTAKEKEDFSNVRFGATKIIINRERFLDSLMRRM